MKYPEIREAMESSDITDDWDVEGKEANGTPLAIHKEENQNISQNGDSELFKQAGVDLDAASAEPGMLSDDVLPEDDGVAVVSEGDPREHLNLVFIGHVDAGKSTLSGNILYIMGMVDQRTIERYERAAKQRNRESWFLAFIMDTSEEERAKGKTVEVGRAPFSTAIHR